MSRRVVDKVRQVLSLPNVVGYSRSLKKKIVKGRVTDVDCIRIYVSRKVPEKELKPFHVIPREIEGIPTDVVEIGEVKALKADKTGKFRPVIFGISIGNYAITAGTNGWLFKDRKGRVFFGSNAHVFADSPVNRPEEVSVKDIVQPGRYDGGRVPEDVVAKYFWHRKIYLEGETSGCYLAKALASLYNFLAELTGARTRLKPVLAVKNKVDFAVAEPLVDYELRFPDFSVEEHRFVGLGFAGSDRVSCVCKARHIVGEGYWPVDVETYDVTGGDVGKVVEKSGRTSCYSKAEIVDDSAEVRVRYDEGVALFTDVILTEKLLEPGDSGSSVWIKVV